MITLTHTLRLSLRRVAVATAAGVGGGGGGWCRTLLPCRCESTLAHSYNAHEEIRAFKAMTAHRVSIKSLMEFGQGKIVWMNSPIIGDMSLEDRLDVQLASFLHHELPVRIAHSIDDLERCEALINTKPIQKVCELYERSFQMLRLAPPPISTEAERSFHGVVQKVFNKQSPILSLVAQGVYQVRKLCTEQGVCHIVSADVQEAMDRFHLQRIGLRMLIGQYLALKQQHKIPSHDLSCLLRSHTVGLICQQTNIKTVARAAAGEAQRMCLKEYGVSPSVFLRGKTDITFPYVQEHLFYILLELLKNSMRAVVERHFKSKKLPEIFVIADVDPKTNDLLVRVRDYGGGIDREHMEKIWSYMFTTVEPKTQEECYIRQFLEGCSDQMVQDHLDARTSSGDSVYNNNNSQEHEHCTAPLAGLGYGLPLSRLYARYFAGDLQLLSEEGKGTEAVLRLSRLGDGVEPIH